MIASIEEIMHNEGVGKKRAYAIRRRLQNEAHTEPVPTNQRNRVLEILYRRGEEIHNSHELTAVLQSESYAIDDHDATKVLWSLQKTNHVKFREGHSRYGNQLFAVRLTLLGIEAARQVGLAPEAPPFVTERIPDVDISGGASSYNRSDADKWRAPERLIEEEAGPEDLSDVKEVAQRAAAMQEAVNDLGAGPEDQSGVEMAGEPSIFHLDMAIFPAIREVRDRARKAKKIEAALRILEEVGEDEAALALMSKIEFTPLELEVIDLLERYEEN